MGIKRILISAGFFYLNWSSIAVAQLSLEASWINASRSRLLSESLAIAATETPAPGQTNLELEITQTPVNLPPPGSLDPPRNDLDPLPADPNPTLDPIFPPQPPSPPVPTPSAPDLAIRVKRIQVLGSTAFSTEELQAAVRAYLGQEVTYEEILAIRTQITELYRDRGYTTSGAFLPPQDLSDGNITIQVVEGALERLEVKGLEQLQEGYIRSRIGLAATPPLNIRRLEEALHLLQLNPLLDRVQAELSAGTAPGLSVLTLQIQEASTLTIGIAGENADSPSVGSMAARVYATQRNLSGLGDRLAAELRDTRGLTQYSLSYDIPLNPRDGTLSLRMVSGRSKVIEFPFEPLGIRSQSSTISLGFRQPLILTPTTEFAVSAFLDWRESETFLFDTIPFSFSLGPELGKSRVTALRLTQDWVSRSDNRVLAARSQLNIGLPLFDATLNDSGVDAAFFSWNGQFQWVEAFSPDVILVARIGGQIAFDSLLPLEQFSIGGLDTVRGYRRNQRVADSGIVGSLEVRWTVLRDAEGWPALELSPFFDLGTVWNHDSTLTPISAPTTLASLGLGAHWQLNRTLSLRLDWGFPLIPLEGQGNTIQDRGLIFSIRFQPFN